MNIIWFSEIRWDYLKTRKQHLLSHFPSKDNILFIQPYNFSKKKYLKSVPKNIVCKTVPIFRGGNRLLILLSNRSFIRLFTYTLLIMYTKLLVKKYLRGTTDVICISNIFYIPIIKKLNDPIVWDYNDDPEQFGPIPEWISKLYNNILSNKKTKIISCSKGLNQYIYTKFSNKPITIPNGVELKKFQNYQDNYKNNKKLIIGYVGIVSKWFFDFDLIKIISEKYPICEIRIYGPKDKNALRDIEEISSLQNVTIYPEQNYDVLPSIISGFSIGLIPLKSFEKVWRAASGKLLQYLAVGIPVVSVYMEQYAGLNNLILCKTHEEFINGIDYYLKNENVMLKKNNLSEYDWIVLADQYRKILTKNIDKNKNLNL